MSLPSAPAEYNQRDQNSLRQSLERALADLTQAKAAIKNLQNTPPGTGVEVDDEGVPLGTATTLDFVGAGVVATFGAGTATITIDGGGGGTGTLDGGFADSTYLTSADGGYA